MCRTLKLLLLLLAAALLPVQAAVAQSKKTETRKSDILFAGNSYTYCNNLPLMLEAMLKAGSQKSSVAMFAKGSYTLDMHLADKDLVARIKENCPAKVLILQDQSMRPSGDAEGLSRDVGQFKKLAADANPKCRIVLYMTWGYRSARFEEMSDILAAAYRKAAADNGVACAPVGIAWKHSLKAKPGLTLHTGDDSHPNAAGTYLAACTLYATISGKSPVGLPAKLTSGNKLLVDLGSDTARHLQKMALVACTQEQGLQKKPNGKN